MQIDKPSILLYELHTFCEILQKTSSQSQRLMQIDKPFVFLQISVVAIVPNMALWAVMADSKSLQAIMGAGGLDQWSISAAGLEHKGHHCRHW